MVVDPSCESVSGAAGDRGVRSVFAKPARRRDGMMFEGNSQQSRQAISMAE